MQTFSCKTVIHSGSGAISALAGYGAQRLYLVADPFFAKNGWADRVAKASGAREVKIFDRVTPDPSVALAAEGQRS